MYTPASKPTMYFIGVTTGKSSIMKVFPKWAEFLNFGDCEIKGIDLKWHDDPSKYHEVVEFIKNDRYSLGALVTTHKIDLLNASLDLFDELDDFATVMGEVSGISKLQKKLYGHAKDPITSGLSLEAFLPKDYWIQTGAEVFILGAGGSSIALSSYFMKKEHGKNKPSKIIVSNRSTRRLEEMKKIHEKINTGIPVEYYFTPNPEDSDLIVNNLKSGSLVVNATGLGKDAPGSPITFNARFPEKGIAWDFNYRGELVFLNQARAQQHDRNLQIEDGWIYFIHGWTRVIAEVFHVDIPVKGPMFDKLSEIAASTR
ncbi:MAG: hypothetical protein JXJ22_11840 [Bacteroidales bacterium]|nr:hypothetical protein [Bacteroidales bacterium]